MPRFIAQLFSLLATTKTGIHKILFPRIRASGTLRAGQILAIATAISIFIASNIIAISTIQARSSTGRIANIAWITFVGRTPHVITAAVGVGVKVVDAAADRLSARIITCSVKSIEAGGVPRVEGQDVTRARFAGCEGWLRRARGWARGWARSRAWCRGWAASFTAAAAAAASSSSST